MRIVIAAWHLRDFNVGIGRYCRNLIEAIAKVDRENEYEILMAKGDQPLVSVPNMTFTRIRFPLFRRQFWEQVSHLLIKPYDVLHFPYDSFIFYKRGKFVATIHDMLPVIFQSKRLSFNLSKVISSYWMKDRAKKMDRIITDSEFSKQEIERLLNVPSEKVTAIHLGVGQKYFMTIRDASVLKRFGVDRDYLLYVGSNSRAKNPEAVIQAYRKMPPMLRKQYCLVLVGDFRQSPDLLMMVTEKERKEDIVFTGIVSEDDLLQLYKNASVFIFPYLYSGFCLPVIEAMASGVPCIVSNRSSFPEVAGEAADLVDPENINNLSSHLENMLLNANLRTQLIVKGIERAQQFTWEKTAKKTIEVYRQVAME
jgi:glycosyltransferase involved in cell wall biosynthesis